MGSWDILAGVVLFDNLTEDREEKRLKHGKGGVGVGVRGGRMVTVGIVTVSHAVNPLGHKGGA